MYPVAQQQSLFVGAMSGTSLDGVDVVVFDNHIRQVLAHHFLPYPHELRTHILQLIQKLTTGEPSSHSPSLLWAQELGIAIAQFYNTAISALLAAHSYRAQDICAIGAHGQTVYHQPQHGYSVQLLQGALLAESSGIDVVCDFRTRDICAGGQGAPLVPAFHHACFAAANKKRAVINIGGIANITWLDGLAQDSVCGYDIGPGNVLLDAWYQQHHSDKLYDDEGRWAKSGKVAKNLLAVLLCHPFFAQAAPKSSGREDFHLAWLHNLLQQTACEQLPAADIQATLLALTVETIAQAIEKVQDVDDVAVCGGGAFNLALLAYLEERLQRRILTTQDWGIPAMQVEAAAFAWLAAQCMGRQTANLPRVTGASGARILGALYLA